MAAFSTWVGFSFTLQNVGISLLQFAETRPEQFLGIWVCSGGPVGAA
jgi:hypothetical protein